MTTNWMTTNWTPMQYLPGYEGRLNEQGHFEARLAQLPEVAGDWMDDTHANFQRRAQILLEIEQAKLSPDNQLISILCDAVRVSRECGRLARTIASTQAAVSRLVDQGC